MPKVVENMSAANAKLLAPARKNASPRQDSADSFEKILKDAQPKQPDKPLPSGADSRPRTSENPADAAAENASASKPETSAENPQPDAKAEPDTDEQAVDQHARPSREEDAPDAQSDDAQDSDLTALAIGLPHAVDLPAAEPVTSAGQELPQDLDGIAETDAPAVTAPRPAIAAAAADVESAVASEAGEDAKASPTVAAASRPPESPNRDSDSAQPQAQNQPNTQTAVAKPLMSGTEPVSDEAPADLPAPVEAIDAAAEASDKPTLKPHVERAESKPVAAQATPAPSGDVPTAGAGAPEVAPDQTAAPQAADANTLKAPDAAKAPAPTAQQPPQVRPESEFAGNNHDRIVSAVRAELTPNGGTMRMRLDPPELGVLQVTVRMVNGAMTASFETSNDQATRLLSHSLAQLKQALETQGVSVDRIHVQQSPRDQQAGSNSDDQQGRHSQQQDESARQEQQRKEMLRRLWRRLGVGDPLDLVA